MSRVLVCIDPTPNADGSCTTSAWLEQPSFLLPPMTVEEAQTISSSALLAFAAVMAVKVATRKSQ